MVKIEILVKDGTDICILNIDVYKVSRIYFKMLVLYISDKDASDIYTNHEILYYSVQLQDQKLPLSSILQ